MTSEFPRGLFARLQAGFGCLQGRRLASYALSLPRIDAFVAKIGPETDEQLGERSLSLCYRAGCGEPLARLLPEAYALVREAARRTVGMRHFDVQIIGGLALFHGAVTEMETGEGKTLTATLPLFLRALTGRGALLATVNDYLAHRDARWMEPIYKLLGLSVGLIQTGMNSSERRQGYGCDITYGTAKEFGFDFLRDRLAQRRSGGGWTGGLSNGLGSAARSSDDLPVQRRPYFALVDEADSVLIDESRTPLIIGAVSQEARDRAVACYRWCAAVAVQFTEETHYEDDAELKTLLLTPDGRELARSLSVPEEMRATGQIEIFEHIERAIRVQRDFIRDQHYIVRDGEVVIVDEFTGRLGEGRKWRPEIQHAVEAKDELKISTDTSHVARVTVQEFFLRFQHLAGMTGTARSSARELRKFYRLGVVPIPTNRPIRRARLPDRILTDADAKWTAVVESVQQLHAEGRPVLIGVRSIDKSEQLGRLLTEVGIDHRLLNARNHAAEAEIVARAGQPGNVTVATNMAGRGTDILLGDGVSEKGGLHVIGTEMHESARIDRQLFGRAGRQGDPGSGQQFLALDDEILISAFGKDKVRTLTATADANGESNRLGRLFQKAQRIVERRHFRQRLTLQYYDKQRQISQLEMGQDPYLDAPS